MDQRSSPAEEYTGKLAEDFGLSLKVYAGLVADNKDPALREYMRRQFKVEAAALLGAVDALAELDR